MISDDSAKWWSTSGSDGVNQNLHTPSITLPKGGGAIRGIGEKFAANPVTGTGSMSVPIATSPGRSGFGPKLSLSYDSGSGNGPFGFGWTLSLPSITRKTDKGLPQYRDAEESDVFILSGAEDLVPELDAGGNRHEDTDNYPSYTIHRYRPRIEGLFARIERWTKTDDPDDVHWRSYSPDNVLTIYGKDANSRIADPNGVRRIFSWLICESRDDKGNAVVYEYAEEDGTGVDLTQAHESNRGDLNDAERKVNRYLKRIFYGNRVPLQDVLDSTGKRPRSLSADQLSKAGWMFEVVLDYGEHDPAVPTPQGSGDWACRNDPFSSYRASFEVRTYRLCQRVLMFHHIPDLPSGEQGYEGLVRSTDFTYSYEHNPNDARNPVYSFLDSVTQSGYKRVTEGYLKRSLPALEFEYTQPVVQDAVEIVDAENLENLPIGLDGDVYQWIDLHGEGIPGILTEQAGAWFYKRNLSPTNGKPDNGRVRTKVEFAPVELVASKPNLALSGGQAQFMDLAGDGQPDLVVLDGPIPGFYEHDEYEGWQPFRPFTSHLSRDMRDSNVKLVDLDGNGHADALITENNVFIWHASLAEEGFGSAQRVYQALDEEHGPRLVFSDGTQSIYLADLSGDGLTDLARIRNGEVCYWPNLGYARFGAKVTMDNAPHLDIPDQFDQRRVRLADIDGSGTTDIIYLGRDGVRLYFNQSGNSWSAPRLLDFFPQVDNLAAIMAVDLCGNGTACLVWSSPQPGDVQRQMRYVNLLREGKPHLLVKSANNLGAETQVEYASSTKFYLQDRRNGKPWITRLPFPVHVVERVITDDQISRNRFATRYAYHHGYFYGEEREFRGFGMVEQWDTEEFGTFEADGLLDDAENLDQASHVPPVLTKTWYHTGIYLGRERVSRGYENEYYPQPGLVVDKAPNLLLSDTILPDNLTTAEEREACRALKGSMLRQEVFAVDGTDDERHPYTITEQNFTVKTLQPRGDNRHAVFFTHPREAITCHYERNPADQRISHAMTLEVDAYGNALKSVAIGYGRRKGQSPLSDERDRRKQEQLLITCTENDVTYEIEDIVEYPDDYRTPLPAETRTYELTGFEPENNAVRFSYDEWTQDDFALLASAAEIPFEQVTDNGSMQKRLIERVRTIYRADDLSKQLDFRELQPKALPGESYQLAFTPGLLNAVYQRNGESLLSDPAEVLGGIDGDKGGYVYFDGGWWIPSGRMFYHPEDDLTDEESREARQHFFLPRRFEDPFAQCSEVTYDDFDLLILTTSDALDNCVIAANDYRVLQPTLVTDPNGNRTQVAFDTLGLVVGTAVMGKPPPDHPLEGDSLKNFQPDLSQAQLNAFIAQPRKATANPDGSAATQIAHDLLRQATTRIVYNLDRFQRLREPPFAATLARETHVSKLEEDKKTKIQISFSYSDGFGREIQKKIQAEPGPIPLRDAEGNIIIGTDGQPEMSDDDFSPRWIGSGWTVFNNKDKPVRRYEPFFTDRHRFEFDVRIGVSPVLFYDPIGRVVATVHPNQTLEKVIFDPWKQTTYDVNDTVAPRNDQTGDPRTDRDIEGYVREYFEEQNGDWRTWYGQRIDGQMGAAKREAANKAAIHADTPSAAHFDALGRPFLTVALYRYERRKPDNTIEIVEEPPHETRVELDIEGNQRAVIDAKGRVVMRYDYHMAEPANNEEDAAANRIHQASMEAGERWVLNDVTGNPIRAWDSRGFERRMTYDELRRPTGLYVTDRGEERLAERIVYGECEGDADNHRMCVYQTFDGAGIVTNVAYDFKGNLLESCRDLLPDYQVAVNWNDDPDANDGSFTSHTTYDALNRPRTVTSPDGSVYRPTFNEANLLETVDVHLRGAVDATPFVTDIDYDAKGQRTRIDYDNGASTVYEYDPLTFRLVHLKTTRPAGWNGFASELFSESTELQDLHYTYDPAGNITCIEDKALRSLTYNGEQVDPVCHYTYDAIYRLIEAQGREHIGQTAFDFNPRDNNRRDYPFLGAQAHASDPRAMRNFSEIYEYDAAGNFERMRHVANGGSWTRNYFYEEDSLIEPESGVKSNRLTRTEVGNGINHREIYSYTDAEGNDAHGCMTAINAMAMTWDFEDQLQRVDLGGGGTAYYVYDAGGQRMRTVIHRHNGTRHKERIYLGGFEIYREYNGSNGNEPNLVHETLHIMDDQKRIALVETRTKGDDDSPYQLLRYQLGNHLGSAILELDQDGVPISYEEYHPYGSTSFQAVDKALKATAKRYRFTGKERDEESGLYYHDARYYASWLGRWISCDPIGIGDTINPYEFVRVDPINRIEIDGMESGLWDRTNETTRQVRSWVDSTATNAGDWIMNNALHLESELGVAGTYLGDKIMFNAVLGASITHIGIKLLAGTLMIGPNILEGLDTAGNKVGEGAGMMATANTTEESWLGLARIFGGVGEASLVGVELLSMTTAPTKSNLPRKKGESQGKHFTRVKKHGRKFEKKVAQQQRSIFTEVVEQVTIEPLTKAGRGAGFRVRVDNLVRSRITGRVRPVEAKSTANAGLTKRQQQGYPLLGEFGGIVRGKGGGTLFPAGTVIPASEVLIMRPKGVVNDLLKSLLVGILGHETYRNVEEPIIEKAGLSR